MHARLKKRGIRQYAAMTKKTYAGVCEGFDYFSPTGSWQQQKHHWVPLSTRGCRL